MKEKVFIAGSRVCLKINILFMNKKSGNKTFFAVMALMLLFFASFFWKAFAAETSVSAPELKKITEIKKDMVVLPITADVFKGSDAVAMVSIKKSEGKSSSSREMKVHFNENGLANVNIGSLEGATKYEFKVSIKGENDANFSTDSNSEEATTL